MERYEPVYQELLQKLEQCEQKRLPFPTEMVQCFSLSYQYWSFVVREIHDSSPSQEEITLYAKKVLPPFIALVNYYQLLYHTTLFVPEENKEARRFWRRERLRMQQFMVKQGSFYTYYLSGKTHLDAYYFSRISSSIPCYGEKGNSLLSYSGDLLLGQLLALQRYQPYVEKQLALLPLDLP